MDERPMYRWSERRSIPDKACPECGTVRPGEWIATDAPLNAEEEVDPQGVPRWRCATPLCQGNDGF